MNNLQNEMLTINNYFEHIIQLNSFDAVVILKHKENQEYEAIIANNKAVQFFNISSFFPVNIDTFFLKDIAIQLHQILTTLEQNKMLTHISHYILYKTSRLPLRIHEVVIQGDKYYNLIFRTDVAIEPLGELADDIVKHLSFVEHNVNPVLSADLKGKIVYTNIAASEKMNTQHEHFMKGHSIFEYIAERYREEFSNIFQRALAGSAEMMLKCQFKKNFLGGGAYHLKFFPTYWERKVIGVHIVLKDTDSFQLDNDVYQYLVLRDELTGLLNRSALKEHWKNEFDHHIAQNKKLAYMLIDLDRFKKFNESLGEEKGDELILNFCARLESLYTENVRLYRYSGDEFVFILKNLSRDDIEKFASAILSLLKIPFIIDKQEYFISVSIGIALAPTDGNDLESLTRKADQALFHVKEHGRSNYKFYRDDMGHAFPNEALMEAHLRRAIEFNELSLHLQPQINLFTNEIDSFEALLRWNNRKFGFVPPSQFIPIAEASGLIIEIGDWILETVCRYQQEWREKGYRPVRIAVNISPKQFVQEQFARKIETIIRKYDVDPSSIELEITESSMTNINETYSILTELKRLGIYVSVDDFGTGYSSLSYLKRYPIDIIKIDQSFIADIEKDEKNEAIIKAIILLSHSLGLEVVAEGVEAKFQESFLKEYSCQKVQGYLYNKPLPVDEIISQYLLN